MRIRTIKPEFFLHEGLFDLERECSLPIRLAFAGLWCAADREGRFGWEPRKLKAQILPYDEVDFSRVLHALTTRGFIVRYTSSAREYGWIPSFSRHQVINNRERPSEMPAPPEGIEQQRIDACPTRAPRDNDACPTVLNPALVEGKGREQGREQGREGKTPLARFSPPSIEEVLLHAAKIGLPDSEAKKFFAYYGSNGWKVGKNPMKSWVSAIGGWKVRWETDRNGTTQHRQLTLAEKQMLEIQRQTERMFPDHDNH